MNARGSGLRLPVATLALALAGGLALFVLQSNDPRREAEALSWYRASGLAAIELPRYRDELVRRSDADGARRLAEFNRLAPAGDEGPLRLLASDREFLRALRAGVVVEPGEPIHDAWMARRRHYEELANASAVARFGLTADGLRQPWRLLSYPLLQDEFAGWLAGLAVLALAGPLVELAAGPWMLLAGFAVGGVVAGAVHLGLSGATLVGPAGALAAVLAMMAILYGARRLPPLRLPGTRRRLPRVPLATLALAGLALELVAVGGPHGGPTLLAAEAGGAAAGAALLLLRGPLWRVHIRHRLDGLLETGILARRPSTLLAQAREALATRDHRRAVRLYRELVELEPKRVPLLAGFLDAALLDGEPAALHDAALQLLWTKARRPSVLLRQSFLHLTQPRVLAALPVDEQLRLARRLVRFHEDAAALRLIDALLADAQLRERYGRQLADCLLGLYTAYTRHRLHRLAASIHERLTTWFVAPESLGGVPPAANPPSTVIREGQPGRR